MIGLQQFPFLAVNEGGSAMRRTFKTVRWLLMLVLVAGVVVVSGGFMLLRRSLP